MIPCQILEAQKNRVLQDGIIIDIGVVSYLEWQGQGVGAGLLRNAMQRSVQVADIAGVRVMLVHAKDEKAKVFYEHFDFATSPTDPYHLYVLIKDIRKAMGF